MIKRMHFESELVEEGSEDMRGERQSKVVEPVDGSLGGTNFGVQKRGHWKDRGWW